MHAARQATDNGSNPPARNPVQASTRLEATTFTNPPPTCNLPDVRAFNPPLYSPPPTPTLLLTMLTPHALYAPTPHPAAPTAHQHVHTSHQRHIITTPNAFTLQPHLLLINRTG